MTPLAVPTPSDLLFWLSGALGDTLLAYPVLGALRRWAPSCAITAVGRPAYLAFAARSGLVDRIEDVDGPPAGALLAGAGYRISDPHADSPRPRSAQRAAQRAPGTQHTPPDFGYPTPKQVPQCAVFFSSAYRQLALHMQELGVPLLIGSPPHSVDSRHQTRYLLDCLRPLGIDRRLLPVTMDRSLLPPVPESVPLGPPDRPCILMHPGAGARWKRWPLAQYLALADLLRADGVTVRWSCGPAEEDLRAALHAATAGTDELLPALDLDTLASLLCRCAAVVTPDTGIAHLAALFGVSQVTLFGPTDPRRWRPVSRQAIVLRAPDLCGGTWEISADDPGQAPRLALCRCDPFIATGCRCLAALPVDRVLEACRAFLA